MLSTDRQIRRLLLIGFGGLLLLLAFSGVAALSVIQTIQAQNEEIREDYLNRDQILEQLRSDVYLSGTVVRDLLLERNPSLADAHHKRLEQAEARIQANISAYRKLLRGEESEPFQDFTRQLNAYLAALQPTLDWTAEQRQQFGYAFMTNSLLPRRAEVVALADQIGLVNKRQMQLGNQEIFNLFSRFRRTLLIGVLISLLCGAALAAGSMQRILRLEQISTARLGEAEQTREQLRDLSARLIDIQESERRSISRELHDEVGQSVSALLLGIGNVAAGISPDTDPATCHQLSELRRLAEKTVAVVRDMSLLLRPSMLDDLGLIPTLEWQAREISRNNHVYVQVNAGPMPEDLPDEYKTCVYRVVQEALRNAARHAHAEHAHVDLEQQGANLSLVIEDDGKGFVPNRTKGLGLLGMEERVIHLQGTFRVESHPDRGTTIRVQLPLPTLNA